MSRPAPRQVMPGPPGRSIAHVYAIAPSSDGAWAVWCYRCTELAGAYTYPCQVGAPAIPGPTPPQTLLDPAAAGPDQPVGVPTVPPPTRQGWQ